MLNTEQVIERVREIIEPEYNNTVLDKNVAYELGISSSNLATMKSRRTIDPKFLTEFCVKRKVNTNWLFFGVGEKEMHYA